jgi:AcrR family transcriptional regulator
VTQARAIRRTQAERTAATRERIMRAVVESIAEIGFQKTTANEITRRAGVTWGAVQHHFGGKDGILDAVLEESMSRFAARLAEVPTEGVSLAERVSAFVDIAWAHFGSPDYRSMFEILLNYTPEEDGANAGVPVWQSEMLNTWNDVWSQIFADVDLPRRKRVALQAFSISVVSGMAALGMIRRAIEPVQGAELDLLKRTLVREMSGSD